MKGERDGERERERERERESQTQDRALFGMGMVGGACRFAMDLLFLCPLGGVHDACA